MSYRTYRKFQAFLLAGLAFYLLERFWAGRLMLYINPRYQWLVVLAAFGLMALAVILFNNLPPVWKEEEGLLSSQVAPKGAKWQLLILLFPLLLGVLIPAKPLDANVAEGRGVSQTLPLTAGGEPPVALEVEPGSRTILQWLWAFDSADDPGTLVGQPVDVQGFVLNNPGLPESYFMVGRFIVSCCVADAVVLGIPVLPPENLDVPDGWVRVQGQVQIISINGEDSLTIDADHLTFVDPPDQPYLYP